MRRSLGVSRRRFLQGTAGVGIAGAALEVFSDLALAADHTVRDENTRIGTPRNQWWPGRDPSIVGFPSEFSVAPGDTVTLKVLTTATDYTVSILRMGWYGGDGARQVHTQRITLRRAQRQPAAATDPTTLLVDCSTWSPSATWTVPTNAVSGVYLVNFRRSDTGGANHTWFVVRRPGPSDVLVQTSEMTWHAYNRYGGSSLYWSQQGPFADRVSYQRPFDIDGIDNEFLTAEYPLIRWLERNGFDVAYGANLDTHRNASLLTNRKVFVSSGHDEYWSGPMRANVEAARDAGVHLMFLSGNEVFWRVRLEPSIGPGAQSDQTITCYKETTDNTKSDPSPEWTGTWRDPRFTPPAVGGANPEHRLTGQLFRCIFPMGVLDPAIEVPARFAPLRFWRHTTVASLEPNATQALGMSTLGFEWDVDVDDDDRPPGLIQLSETTASVPDVLQDFGSTYAPGRETHHLTLYRSASGALVFGAGTVQWAFGLDEVHQSDQVPADRTMQQATLNLLADMGVQPTTPQSDLVTSAASTDTQPPVSRLTSPEPGAAVPVGSTIVISGTAQDLGGGVVAGVEVSLDDGRTWRRATGTTEWSVVTVITSPLGARTLRCRATDDSANLEIPSTGVPIEIVTRPLPATLFPDGYRPAVASTSDVTPVEVGLRFRSVIDGRVTALRCFRGPGDTAVLTGSLWSATGARLATATFPTPASEGWQEVPITAVSIPAGVDHVVSVWRPEGRYGFDVGLLNGRAYEVWPLMAPASGDATAGAPTGNGLFRFSGPGFPTATYAATSYGLDLRFDNSDAIGDGVKVLDTRPPDALERVAITDAVHVVLSDAVDPTASNISLVVDDDPAAVPVAGTLTWNATTRTMSYTPASPLAPGRRYRAQLTVTRTAQGAPLNLDHTWRFTTTGPVGTLPAGLADTATTPSVVVGSDTSAVELGVRVRSREAGVITAVRAYVAPGSPGPIVGHVWRANGALVATAVISAQGATAVVGFGWRQATLDPPVPVSAGEVITVSYHAPGGVYPAIPGALAASDLGLDVVTAPASPTIGGNGVYRYGPSAFPTDTYLGTWYLTDVVFDRTDAAPDVVVVERTPTPGLVAVHPTTDVTVTWSGAIDQASATLTVTTPSGPATGTLEVTNGGRTVAWRPALPLPDGVEVTVQASARPAGGGTVVTSPPWTFRVDGGEGTSPATLWTTAAVPAIVEANDTNPVELGVVWRSDVDARATALRFFKGAGNTGPHVGRLWTIDGQLLGTVTFPDSNVAGWQQAPLTPPVPVMAGTTYVASYHAPAGRYSINVGTFADEARRRPPLVAPASTSTSGNGRFVYGPGGFPSSSYLAADYGVDVVVEFDTGLTIVERQPAPGATDVAWDAPVVVGFDRGVDAASVQIGVLDDFGTPLTGITAPLDDRSVQWRPDAPYPAGRRLTITVLAAQALDGTRLATPVNWFITTEGAAGVALWSLFPPSDVPAVASTSDASTVELGVRVRCAVDADVVAVRHFVGPTNAGPHTVRLWSDTGTLLAETTAPTGSGWVETRLPTPVAVSAGGVVVASYVASRGGYSFDIGRLAAPVTSGPLTAPADGEAGPNGCFRYGGGFPDTSYLASSYGVDVVVAVRS
jgi:hypothetical protein